MEENRTNRSFRKSLTSVVVDTMGFGAIFYPVYAGVQSLTYSSSFIENLKDTKTIAMAVGVTTGMAFSKIIREWYRAYKK